MSDAERQKVITRLEDLLAPLRDGEVRNVTSVARAIVGEFPALVAGPPPGTKLTAASQMLMKWFENSGSGISARWMRIPPEERGAIIKAFREAMRQPPSAPYDGPLDRGVPPIENILQRLRSVNQGGLPEGVTELLLDCMWAFVYQQRDAATDADDEQTVDASKLLRILDQLDRQNRVNDTYANDLSDKERHTRELWLICNSHIKDRARELREALTPVAEPEMKVGP